jgi:hypothetical protein
MEDKANRRALFLLSSGAFLGIFLGVATTFHKSTTNMSTLPDDAIALVNGKSIQEEEYTRALALLAGDKRTEITNADRTHVLDRLIEEELLVQYGIESGLVDSDRSVRKAMTQAMLASIVAESTSEQPSEDALRVFHEKNASLFGSATFAEIREQVEAVYRQHTRDDALRKYLEWLRSEAKIVLVPGAIQ